MSDTLGLCGCEVRDVKAGFGEVKTDKSPPHETPVSVAQNFQHLS